MVHGLVGEIASRAGGGVPRVVQARSVSPVGLQEDAARPGDAIGGQAWPGTRPPVLPCGGGSAGHAAARRGITADAVLVRSSPCRVDGLGCLPGILWSLGAF